MDESGKFQDLWTNDDFQSILSLNIDELKDVVSHRKRSNKEVRFAFRDLNKCTRSYYAEFIKSVGRSIYPLIIATDYDEFGHSGVGTTFTLYLKDGSERKIVPALGSNYEIYKSVSHIFLGIMVILSPYLHNPKATAWHEPLFNYSKKIEIALNAVYNSDDPTLEKELLRSILESCLNFISSYLENSNFILESYIQFSKENMSMIKKCFIAATKVQAKKNIEALLEWKEMLGPELWRKIYVVIPTIYPVATTNPRIEIFRNLLDEDKINTNIIASEYPRNAEDSRTLLGRVVGDRGLGRFIFGVDSHEAILKTVALLTGVDVVSDDAIPNIHEVLRNNGIEPRPYKTPNREKRQCPPSSRSSKL